MATQMTWNSEYLILVAGARLAGSLAGHVEALIDVVLDLKGQHCSQCLRPSSRKLRCVVQI